MNKHTTLALCIIAASTYIPNTALSAEPSGLLEEVVVTARKREETVQSVPIPITAVSAEQLQSRSIRDITEIGKLSPNTDIRNGPVNGSATQVFLRGIGQINWSSTQDPKIGIYIDGVYLSRPQGGLVDLMDIERVEVLRGPQGTLFGRNTTAGLIHLITKSPSDEREFEAELGVGTDGYQTQRIVWNQPLTDNAAMRFAIYNKESDGFITNSLTGKDRGNENAQSYRGSFAWTRGGYDMRFIYDRFKADERAPLGVCRFTGPENGAEAGGLPALLFVFGVYDEIKANCRGTTRHVSTDTAPNESVTSDVDAYVLNQSYDLGWATITSISAYRDIDNFNGTWGWVLGGGPGVNLLDVLNNHGDHEIFSQELRLSGSAGRVEWVFGAYYFNEESYESLEVPLFRDVPPPVLTVPPASLPNPAPPPATLGEAALGTQAVGSRSQVYDVTNKNRAVFAEATIAISERLDLTVGARYTEDERQFTRIQKLYSGGFDFFYNCPGMVRVLSPIFMTMVATTDRCYQEVEYDKVTPRAILSYDATDNVMLYGSYSVGYSSGGFNQDERMRAFLPEVSDNWELGAKTTLLDSRLRLNGTFFYNTYENQQLTVGRIVNGQPTADLINAQEAVLWGVEFEALAQLTDTLSIAATAGYLEGEYNEFSVVDNLTDPVTLLPTPTLRDLSHVGFGNDGDNMTFDVSLMHEMSLSAGGTLASTIGFSFTDEQYYTLENTPSSRTDSYWLIDARITWHLANDKTSISLWSTNLADEGYVANMINQSGTTEIGGTDPSLGMSADYWGDPRRVGFEVRQVF